VEVEGNKGDNRKTGMGEVTVVKINLDPMIGELNLNLLKSRGWYSPIHPDSMITHRVGISFSCVTLHMKGSYNPSRFESVLDLIKLVSRLKLIIALILL